MQTTPEFCRCFWAPQAFDFGDEGEHRLIGTVRGPIESMEMGAVDSGCRWQEQGPDQQPAALDLQRAVAGTLGAPVPSSSVV